MSAYRSPTLTPPVDTTPPWWQRVWFCVNRRDACERWQWARREVGGRWSWGLYGYGIFEFAWARVDDCPGQHYLGVSRAATASRDATLERLSMCSSRRCTCEVWP